MLPLLRKASHKILLKVMDLISITHFENLVWNAITRRVNTLSPDQALRFLFKLDSQLYTLEGIKAVEYNNGIHTKHLHTHYHNFFIERVHPGEWVLDVGCGNGFVAWALVTKAGVNVVGIDLSPEKIKQAQKKYQHPRLNFIVGDALRDLPEKHFDVVILSNVLEHMEARPDFLRKVQDKTHPSRLLIRVPLYDRDWRIPLKRELNEEWRLDPTHKIEYTLESFAEEMKAANFKITHQELRWGEIWAEVVPNV